MFITHKGKVMKNKRNQKNIIWKILLIIFSIVLIICLIIIGIQKYQQKKQQEYYETLLENAGSQPQATEEVPEPETEEAPDILKSLGIEIPEKDIDFAALQEENSDVYAWIYVPGTNVDYPVLQHPEDDMMKPGILRCCRCLLWGTILLLLISMPVDFVITAQV